MRNTLRMALHFMSEMLAALALSGGGEEYFTSLIRKNATPLFFPPRDQVPRFLTNEMKSCLTCLLLFPLNKC